MEADRQTALTLTRKKGERIHIGDDVIVEVNYCIAGRVRLTVLAPRKTRILRGELYELTKPDASPVTAED